jgi:hypothetical protein
VTGNVLAVANDGSPGYHSSLAVTFDVAAATPYSLRADVSDINLSGLNSSYSATDLIAVRLRPIGPGSGSPLIDHHATDADIDFAALVEHNHGPAMPQSSGTLLAGRYELTFDVQTLISSGSESGSYSLDFRTGPAVTGVPLPPAVWPALVMLIGLAAACSNR